ncbi:hypothetical protein J6590_028847 [Homalodisca vitripennis]|nr:hypothetical protein J6590_028847 [Homalodisca vitripennis]
MLQTGKELGHRICMRANIVLPRPTEMARSDKTTLNGAGAGTSRLIAPSLLSVFIVSAAVTRLRQTQNDIREWSESSDQI